MIARAEEGDTGQEPISIQRLQTRRDNTRFADHKAFWGSIRTDEAGWLWLSHSTDNTVDYDAPRILKYRILDQRGEYIGDTSLPSGHSWATSHDRVIIEEQNPDTGERLWAVYLIQSAVEDFDYPY